MKIWKRELFKKKISIKPKIWKYKFKVSKIKLMDNHLIRKIKTFINHILLGKMIWINLTNYKTEIGTFYHKKIKNSFHRHRIQKLYKIKNKNLLRIVNKLKKLLKILLFKNQKNHHKSQLKKMKILENHLVQ